MAAIADDVSWPIDEQLVVDADQRATEHAVSILEGARPTIVPVSETHLRPEIVADGGLSMDSSDHECKRCYADTEPAALSGGGRIGWFCYICHIFYPGEGVNTWPMLTDTDRPGGESA